MPIELTFEACVQDAQEYGSDDVWMVSRLFFWIRRDGAVPGDFSGDLSRVGGDKFKRIRISPPPDYTGPMAYADLRQRVGGEFEISPIEVGPPVGAPMPLDPAAFDERSVAYFRGLATESGMMIRVEDGRPLRGGTRPTAHIRLSNNVFVKRRTVTVEARSE
ncbi:MAG: hypothetical protein M3R34_05015 [Acidobacteriota bacterium]|nr:hypothetical protein [Acidobacteriota bacterium]